jgi:hypothetical protein
MTRAGLLGASRSPESGMTHWKYSKSKEGPMSKRARKRRDRKKSGANHGNRPNS